MLLVEAADGLEDLSLAGRKEPVEADLLESLRQDMLEEARDEELGIECRTLDPTTGTITISEGHGAILEAFDSIVGDRDSVDVAADVAEDLSSVTGVLAVDDPLSTPGIGRGLGPETRLVKSITDLAPEDDGERPNRHEKAAVAWLSPHRAERIPTACRGEDVDMRVVPHVASPGVQNRDHPQAGPDVLRIGREQGQGFGSRPDQDGIERLLVGAGQRPKLLRQSEGQEEIGAGEQALTPALEPAARLVAVTLRAMAVLTGVIAVALRIALITAPELASEMWSPAGLDIAHHSSMRGKHVGAEAPAVEISRLAEDLGDLDHEEDQRSLKSLLIRSFAAS